MKGDTLQHLVGVVVDIYKVGGCVWDRDGYMMSPYEQYRDAAYRMAEITSNTPHVDLEEVRTVIQGTSPEHIAEAVCSALRTHLAGEYTVKTCGDWSDNECWLASQFLNIFKRIV